MINPQILLLFGVVVALLIIMLIKNSSSSKSFSYGLYGNDILTAEDDEEEDEPKSCNQQLSTLKTNLQTKRQELRSLRNGRKKTCEDDKVKVQQQIDKIQDRIDNFGKGGKRPPAFVPLPGPGGNKGPGYKPVPGQRTAPYLYF
jgi:hypothetical protein